MGLSASQGRLLSLTSRMSDLELQAQTISNAKIRLSQESSQASNDYSQALDKQVLTVFDADNKAYKNATVANLTGYNGVSDITKQRYVKDSAGRMIVSKKIEQAFNGTYTKWDDDYEASTPRNYDTYKNKSMDELLVDHRFVEFVAIAEGVSDTNNNGTGMDEFNAHVAKMDSSQLEYYRNLFLALLECPDTIAPGDDKLNDSEWLTDQITAGNLTLVEYNKEGGKDGTGDFEDVSWTSGDSALQLKSDTTDTAKAEAKYEATMADIQTKDKRFDLELKNIDTEHTAIQTEVDTVKKVIDKNIERGFKIFNA